MATLFWKDFWLGPELLCDKFPHLYSFVLNEDASVAQFTSAMDFSVHFALPLSAQAFDELLNLQLPLQTIALDDHQLDVKIFTWGTSVYTSAKFY